MRVPAFAAVVLLLLAWDIAIAGRLVQWRTAGAPLRLISGLCGFLVAPALLISVAGSSALTAHALAGLAWLWPLVAWLFTTQVAYVLRRGVATPWVACPLLAFNALVAIAATARYAADLGYNIPVTAFGPGLALAHLQSLLLGASNITSPLLVAVPVLAPAGTVASRAGTWMRLTIAALAAAAVLLLLASSAETLASLESWNRLGSERATEVVGPRPPGSLLIGLRILPELTRIPPATALHDDLALVDSLGVRALLIRVAPEGCTAATLDSLSRSLEALRRDSLVLIVVLGYPRDAAAEVVASASTYLRSRAEDVTRIAQHLGPEYLIPADAPSAAGAAALGTQSAEWWQRYLITTAAAAHAARPATRVMLTLDGDGALDSILYEWAESGSSISATAFNIAPSFGGAAHVASVLESVDRRIGHSGATREHWLFASGSPVLEGEDAQLHLARHVLLWAVARPQMRGVVLADAADYDRMTGFRSAGGRLRRVAADVAATIRALAEPLTPHP